MDSGFYAAAAGLKAQSQALEVAAHNLANINTAGFRGEETTFQSLLALAGPAVSNPLTLATNDYGVLEGAHLDLTPGNLTTTGNPLDVAIEGSGFFVIGTPRGTRYTRNGGFQVSRTGELDHGGGRLRAGNDGRDSGPPGPGGDQPGWHGLGQWHGRGADPARRFSRRHGA